MDGFKRVEFDFSVDGGLAAVNQLEDIISSGHWSDRSLDYNDERTMLLLKMLRFGYIAVYSRSFSPITESEAEAPELWRHARDMNLFVNKRYDGGILLDIADVFSEYEYDKNKTEFNSLFYPELNAYVRSGGLPPYRLLELLERDGCDKIFLFPGNSTDKDDVYYLFALAVPKKRFLDELEKMNERIMETMFEVSRRIAEQTKDIIPPIKFDLPKGKKRSE